MGLIANNKLKEMLLIMVLFSFCACKKNYQISQTEEVDVVLIGGGIMSATLGIFLKELDPHLKIAVLERLTAVGKESSDAWNNAGTGHAAFAEFNYTPTRPDGSIDIDMALKINQQFENTRQFWSYAVAHKLLEQPATFIHRVPHIGLVFGADNVGFLKKRYEAMHGQPVFQDMVFTEDADVIRSWIPLVMEGRDAKEKVAATRVDRGVDVDFGAITRQLFATLTKSPHAQVLVQHEVFDFAKNEDGSWTIFVKDFHDKKLKAFKAKFVFVGAGGGTLPLLQQAELPEAREYSGFPVGGEFLISKNPAIVDQHLAKVYGTASLGAPPMSVPHLDTRFIDGKRYLLFGPFATFSSKFLKEGSYFDILSSFRPSNAWATFQAGWHNLPLTWYLIQQVLLSKDKRVDALREYFPHAKSEDFVERRAGQRVQVIKKVPGKGGVLKFGTELVVSKDKSMIGLLGASPGASVAIDIALHVLDNAFSTRMHDAAWLKKIHDMVPSHGIDLNHDYPQLMRLLEHSDTILELGEDRAMPRHQVPGLRATELVR